MPLRFPARRAPRHRAPRRLVIGGLASLVVIGVVVGSASSLLAPGAAHAATANPVAALHNFTVVVDDDAALGLGGGGEIEGSLAAGGDVSFRTYNLAGPSDGSPLPAVDGPDVQLFSGGTLDIPAAATKLDVNAGYAKISDTTGLAISEGTRLGSPGVGGYLLKQNGPGPQNSISSPASATYSATSYTATAGAFDTAFPASTFAELSATSAALAALGAEDGVHVVTSPAPASEITVTLVPGVVNVWNIGSGYFSGINAVNFTGAAPSATTPLVINVDDAAGTSLRTARFNGGANWFANFVLWNFAGWSELTLASGGSEMAGTVLAPQAALEFARSVVFEGTIVSRSIAITGSAEIHHRSFLPEIPVTPGSATGSFSFGTTACDDTAGSYSLGAAENASYTVVVDGGTPATGLGAGTHSVPFGSTVSITIVPDAGYELAPGVTATGSRTFTAPAPCAVPEPAEVAGAWTVTDQCAVPSNQLVVSAVPGVVYAWTTHPDASKVGTKFSSFTANDLRGEYAFSIAAESSDFELTGPASSGELTFYLPLTCGPLDPTASPETCDAQSTTGEVVDGSINVLHVAGVQFSIATDAAGTDATPVGSPADSGWASYDRPAGTYWVFAEPVDPNLVIDPDEAGPWKLTVELPADFCLPTLAFLPADASGADESCTAEGVAAGTITVAEFPGVRYRIDGEVVTQTTTAVAPGSHLVTAEAVASTDTIESPGRWVIDVADLDESDCELETLSLTGTDGVAWAAALAGGGTLLGIGVLVGVAILRRPATGPRHRLG